MDYSIKTSSDEIKRIDFKEGYSTVIIPTKDNKTTVCVSCQIGCPMKCKFCYTGKIRFKRNLTAEEIVSQVKIAKSIIKTNPTTIVFMGMGEPLLNIKNVLAAAEEIHKEFNVAYHRITLSTSATKNINSILKMPFNLAISLHSPFDKKRKQLMSSSVISIRKILNFSEKFCKIHHKKTYIMFEYSLIKGVNDSEKDLKKLVSIKWPKKAMFNLIEFNKIDSLQPTEESVVQKFKQEIINAGWKCFIRKSRGKDINAACGMLDY